MLKVLIRGGGDLASGIAVRLHRAGINVIITEIEKPLTVRRFVSFAEAIYTKSVIIEDIQAKYVHGISDIEKCLNNSVIPVIIDEDLSTAAILSPDVLIDARMLKKKIDKQEFAIPLVIGIGPGFMPGENCHCVIESNRGPFLGRVYWHDATEPDTGIPENVGGYEGERVLRSPEVGIFRAKSRIGDIVNKDEEVASVNGVMILAPFQGVVRGLLHEGIAVHPGMKVGDLDPRCDPLLCNLVSDKALAIGGGVLNPSFPIRETGKNWVININMKLIDALRIDSKTRLSFVGAGGKTSALIRLAGEWPSCCLAAATAHMGKDQIQNIRRHFILDGNNSFSKHRVSETCLFTGAEGEGNRLNGIDSQYWGELARLADENDLPLFMESDGSKYRPLKAPETHEPPIPDWVNHVVVSFGASVLGKPLCEDYVHRPEIYSVLSGLESGKTVNWHSIMKMLINPQGGLKNIPRQARKSILVNQIDCLTDRTGLPTFCGQLLAHYDSVIIAALNGCGEVGPEGSTQEVLSVEEKIAGIIMAAGNSSRMGQPKAFLNWKGEPFVRACALQAIAAGLDPVMIIAGQDYERIQDAVEDLPVHVVHNPDWNEGQSSSIHAALKAMPKRVGGAIFQLVDQPHIPVALLRRLKIEHSTSLSPIVVPECNGRRANPVLFDRRTFHSLSTIQGDFGGRMIFSQFPIKAIRWFDESILLDVDTPEDYAKLLESN